MSCRDTREAFTAARWGQYTVVRVGNAAADEWTNVGVIVFGPDGKQLAARMDSFERAIRRGDWQAEWRLLWEPGDYAAGVPDLETLKRRLERIGHAMSVIQCREPLPTLLTHSTLDRLYGAFVLGERG